MRLSIVLLVTTACASSTATRRGAGVPYNPPSARFDASGPELVTAVTEAALAQGWDVHSVDITDGVVEAMEPEQDVIGTPFRYLWRFVITGNRVDVALRSEAKIGRRWVSTTQVAAAYTYRREWAQLESIKTHARLGRLAIACAKSASRPESSARAAAICGTAPSSRSAR
jgi:hypothetical protein